MRQLLLLLPLSVVAFGCTHETLTAYGKTGPSVSVSSGPDLRGTWKAELSSKDNEKDPLGQAFANMIVGALNFKMRISEGDAFKVVVLGVPIDGHYTVSGQHITFQPEKMMNKTREQLEQLKSQGCNIDFGDKPLEGELNAGGDTITI